MAEAAYKLNLVTWALFNGNLTEAVPQLLMEGKDPADIGYLWLSRAVMLILLVAGLVLVRVAWRREEGSRT